MRMIEGELDLSGHDYRARLIDAGLIASAGHGLVNFTIPGLRSYLR